MEQLSPSDTTDCDPALPETQNVDSTSVIPTEIIFSEKQTETINAVINNESVLVLGKAGTGKSTVIRAAKQALEQVGRAYIICAPTGVAAINVGGVTVHRFISMLKRGTKYINNGNGFDTVVIDEVSMLRADLFDELDLALKSYSYDSASPFGGFQIILVGDPGQLPPVVDSKEKEETEYLKKEYHSEFFFSAQCYARHKWTVIELDKIFRQEGDKYPKLLNMIRAGENTKTVRYLNNNHLVSAPVGVVLTSRNADADEINRRELAKVPGEIFTSWAVLSATEPQYEWKFNEYPAERELKLKVGARVMVTKNIYRPVDSDQRDDYGKKKVDWKMCLINGDVGEIVEILTNDDDECKSPIQRITINCKRWAAESGGDGDFEIEFFGDGTWEKTAVKEYEKRVVTNKKGETKEFRGKPIKEPVATFTQFPLRLAYAMTIHKAQGATISEPFTVDCRKPMFAAGQLYVALSRGTSLENLHLLGRVRPRDVIICKVVNKFLTDFTSGTGVKAGSIFEQIEHELAKDDEGEKGNELEGSVVKTVDDNTGNLARLWEVEANNNSSNGTVTFEIGFKPAPGKPKTIEAFREEEE